MCSTAPSEDAQLAPRRSFLDASPMPKGPLFSTYRQGENRVTASLMAVFERIDLGKVEWILAGASGESALQLFNFENQVRSRRSASVPDARISANFSLWFETKTAPGQLREEQVRRHLDHLRDAAYERLFLLTPDADVPDVVQQVNDPRLIWLDFKSVSQAIDDLLADGRELVSEKEELLLRELQALFEDDNLLGDPRQVVVVPARSAYPEYLDYHAYVCQPRRPFKAVERMAFYRRGQIEREMPLIRRVMDEVEFSSEHADELRSSSDPLNQEVADLIGRLLESSPRQEGEPYKVFLLTPPGDAGTLLLEQPIANDATDSNGRTTAWVQMQRYASISDLQRARRTSQLNG